MSRFRALWGLTAVACVLVGMAAMTGTAMAATCAVKDGTAKFTGLQEAVTAAKAGDTLKVTGTCEGATVIEKNLTITGKAAILKGGGPVSVVTIGREATVAISGVTITEGQGTLGTGECYCYEGTFGGGIYNKGTLKLSKSTVTKNSISGISSEGGGIYNIDGTATIEKSTVSENAVGGGGAGAGVGNASIAPSRAVGTITVVNSTFVKNNNVAIRSDGNHLTIKHSTFKENSGPVIGTNNTEVLISGKSLISGEFGQFEGPVVFSGGTATIEKSTIEEINNNHAKAGIYAKNGAAVTLIGATVTKNGGAFSPGGGFYLTEGASLKTTKKSKVTGNTAEHGGGVFLTNTAGTVTEEKAGEISGNTPDNLYTEP